MPTIYVITAHRFNHAPAGGSIDPRFLNHPDKYVYFLVDREKPPDLIGQRVLHESDIDPIIAAAGATQLAEWSFLLMEYRHCIADYPFFMVSSRFYDKNCSITTTLNLEWDRLFALLATYGWGFLPSYDRATPWTDGRRPAQENTEERDEGPTTPLASEWIEKFHVRCGYQVSEPYFGVGFPCNYIGFRDRAALAQYVEFYRPVLDFFFDERFEPRVDLDLYFNRFRRLRYRNEKPFSFLLEGMSHDFFVANKRPFVGLHYNGYFEIKDWEPSFRRIASLCSEDPAQLRTTEAGEPINLRWSGTTARRQAIDSTRRGFNRIPENAVFIEKLRRLLPEDAAILDFNSGLGRSLTHLVAAFGRVVSFDGSNYTGEPVIEDEWREAADHMFSVPPTMPLRLSRNLTDELFRFDAVLALRLPPRITLEEFATLVDNARLHLEEGGVFWLGVPPSGAERESPAELLQERDHVQALLREWGWHLEPDLSNYLAPDVGAPRAVAVIAATIGVRVCVTPADPPSAKALSDTVAALSAAGRDPAVDTSGWSEYASHCRERFEQIYGDAYRSLLREAEELVRRGEASDAIDRYLRAVQMDAWDAEVWNNLGKAYLAADLGDDACCAFSIAKSVDIADARGR